MRPSLSAVQPVTTSITPWLLACVLLALNSLLPAQWEATQYLEKKLEEAKLGTHTELGIIIQDAKNGMPYYSFNADRKLTPGSLQRLNTTVAALEILGPEKKFTTRLELMGYQQGKTFNGDIVIIGGGDPSLGSRFSDEPDEIMAVIESMAQAIKKANIKNINGSIIGDDSRYANEPISPFWEQLEIAEWYSAEVSPLCFNENLIDIIWKSGDNTDAKATCEIFPESKYYHFTNGVRTGTARLKTNDIRYYRFAKSNEIRARGRLPQNSTSYDFAAIYNPARYTAYLLWEELKKNGIKTTGEPISTSLVPLDDVTTQSTVLMQIDSPPLRQLLPVMNSENQNLYAEVLLREIAVAKKQDPTFKESCRVVTDWLSKNSLHRTGFLMVDGSGLAGLNSTTVRQISNLLRHVSKSDYKQDFWNSLARPGQGTLKNRFQSDQDPGPQQLIAKTGRQSGVQALAGYLESTEGNQYHFAIIINKFNEYKDSQAETFIDSLVRDIYTEEIFK